MGCGLNVRQAISDETRFFSYSCSLRPRARDGIIVLVIDNFSVNFSEKNDYDYEHRGVQSCA